MGETDRYLFVGAGGMGNGAARLLDVASRLLSFWIRCAPSRVRSPWLDEAGVALEDFIFPNKSAPSLRSFIQALSRNPTRS